MPQEQAENRFGRGMRLQIELPRRVVHDVALLRRRLYEITETSLFATPEEVLLALYVVDSLYQECDHARRTKGFTWNPQGPDEEDGVGPF